MLNNRWFLFVGVGKLLSLSLNSILSSVQFRILIKFIKKKLFIQICNPNMYRQMYPFCILGYILHINMYRRIHIEEPKIF
ncbi:hypothetical protein BpHYR1_034432 [Brachionus plicatilis]|uniref:Uncharacterized protein n=1 Tax=Brachionus plicatilis TaxID=10195 RepID=A0A3M7TAF9_BRAPC|nr:hypothetical protein BpHYR1_034432 [Brachionus plicatilis]